LLRDTLNDKLFDRKWFIQPILVSMNKSQSSGFPAISEKVIPRPLRVNNVLFDFVGPPSKKNAFGFMNSARVQVINEATYSSKNTRYIYDNKIKLYGKDQPNPLLVEGIFSDPRELRYFESPNGGPAYTDDHYPIDPEMAHFIADYIIRFDLGNEQRAVNRSQPAINNE
jgi:hypothetical protein